MAIDGKIGNAKRRKGLHVLSNRNYRLLWSSTTGSAIGSSITYVALAWIIYEKTQSPYAITLLGIANMVPSLIIGLIGGALADRKNRKILMIVTDVARAISIGTLALSIYFFGFNLIWILVVVSVVSAMGAIFRPSSSAFLPTIVDKEDLPDGNGMLFSGMTAANILGSTVGGIIVTVFGIGLALSANTITYILSAVLVLMIVIPSAAVEIKMKSKKQKTSLAKDVAEGLRYVRHSPALLWTILGSLAGNFLLAFFTLYLVVYVSSTLSIGAWAYGALIGSESLGYGIGSVLVGRLNTVRNTGWVFLLGWSFVGILILGVALIHQITFVIGSMLAIGLLSGIANTTYMSCVQLIVPNDMLGRFMSIDEVGSFAVIPLGQIVGGVLVVLIGINETFVISGIGLFVTTILTALSKQVRNLAYPERSIAN